MTNEVSHMNFTVPERVIAALDNATSEYFDGPVTINGTLWDDGDFELHAFHTITETADHEQLYRQDRTMVFNRERIVYRQHGDWRGDVLYLEVVERENQRSAPTRTLHREKIGPVKDWI